MDKKACHIFHSWNSDFYYELILYPKIGDDQITTQMHSLVHVLRFTHGIGYIFF